MNDGSDFWFQVIIAATYVVVFWAGVWWQKKESESDVAYWREMYEDEYRRSSLAMDEVERLTRQKNSWGPLDW